jgi:hypothetical protein
MHGVLQKRKDGIEWSILSMTAFFMFQGFSFFLAFSIFWYTRLPVFQPVISDCLAVNVAVVVLLAVALFQACQWTSLLCSVLFIFGNSTNIWLKLHR